MPVGAASPPRGRHVQAARKPLSGRQFPVDSGPFLHCFVPIRAGRDPAVADPSNQCRLADRANVIRPRPRPAGCFVSWSLFPFCPVFRSTFVPPWPS